LSNEKRIAIIGGTGALGRGLAARLSSKYEVIIGSRERGRARSVAAEVGRIAGTKVRGTTNLDAAKFCGVAILALPNDSAYVLAESLRGELEGKVVISPIVPMKIRDREFVYAFETGSAAEKIASILKGSRVAAAFHSLPAEMLLKVREELDYSVLIAADTEDVFSKVAELVLSIKRLEPLRAGPLSTARMIESLTPMLLNLERHGGIRNPSIRIVGPRGGARFQK